MQESLVTLLFAGGRQRHGPDWVAFGWKPVDIGQEELASRPELHDGPMERAAEPPKYLISPLGRFPLDGIATKRPWNADRARDLPPHRESLGVEKRAQNGRWRGVDDETMSEFAHKRYRPKQNAKWAIKD